MSTNHGDIDIFWVQSLRIGNEGIGTAYVEGGYACKFFGVVDTVFFEYFGSDWYGGVDGVADNGYCVVFYFWCCDCLGCVK
jgi:hypothetical protein